MRSWNSLYIDYLDVMFRPFYYYPPLFLTSHSRIFRLFWKTKQQQKKSDNAPAKVYFSRVLWVNFCLNEDVNVIYLSSLAVVKAYFYQLLYLFTLIVDTFDLFWFLFCRWPNNGVLFYLVLFRAVQTLRVLIKYFGIDVFCVYKVLMGSTFNMYADTPIFVIDCHLCLSFCKTFAYFIIWVLLGLSSS